MFLIVMFIATCHEPHWSSFILESEPHYHLVEAGRSFMNDSRGALKNVITNGVSKKTRAMQMILEVCFQAPSSAVSTEDCFRGTK